MKTFVAIWPDDSVTVLTYQSGLEREQYEDLLWADLDREQDPFAAELYVMRRGSRLILEAEGKYRFASEEEGGRRPAKFSIGAEAFDRHLRCLGEVGVALGKALMANEVVAQACEIGVGVGACSQAEHRVMSSLRHLMARLKDKVFLRDPGISCMYDPKRFGGTMTATLSVLGTKREIEVIREFVKNSDWTNKRQDSGR